MPARQADPWWNVVDQTSLVTIGLIVALLVLAWLVHIVRTWYWDSEDHTGGEEELLTHLRDLKREGELSEEEFRSIKSRLIERMER